MNIDVSAEPRSGSLEAHALKKVAATPRETSLHQEDDVLAAPAFLELVRREQRQADRSKAPLSISVYRIESPEARPGRGMHRLIRLLDASKRETDYLGLISSTMCAVLFPNTDESGTQRFEAAVREKAASLEFSTLTATYPAELFKKLAGESSLRDSAFAEFEAFGTRSSFGYSSKRAVDIIGAATALVMLTPLMAVTALLVRLTSPGPVIFKQTRLGSGGKPFDFYKFRSMAINAGDAQHREFVSELIKGTAPAGAPLKMKADPRVTWVGRIIRRASIDEIPQFINVLKGDMSLVGPRPPLPYEAANYQAWHLRRVLEIKPGMTGLWQVEGRSRVSFNEMVRMDIRYMRKCSLLFDLAIILRTVKVVLRCEGAA